MRNNILIGLFLLSFFYVSAQTSEFTDFGLSCEPLDSVAASDDFLDALDDPAALIEFKMDSVTVSVYFDVMDLEGLQGIVCQFVERGEQVHSETYFSIEDYGSDREMALFRDQKHFVTRLGQYSFSVDMFVKVKLEYPDRETSYYPIYIIE